MSRHRPDRSEVTFAAVVDDLRRHPSPEPEPEPDRRPRLRGPDGRVFVETHEQVPPDQAVAMVAAGAAVAWDSCGCRSGRCGLVWFTAADTPRFVAAGTPVLLSRSRKAPDTAGHLTAWQTDDGQVLVLAGGQVRWGGLLS